MTDAPSADSAPRRRRDRDRAAGAPGEDRLLGASRGAGRPSRRAVSHRAPLFSPGAARPWLTPKPTRSPRAARLREARAGRRLAGPSRRPAVARRRRRAASPYGRGGPLRAEPVNETIAQVPPAFRRPGRRLLFCLTWPRSDPSRCWISLSRCGNSRRWTRGPEPCGPRCRYRAPSAAGVPPAAPPTSSPIPLRRFATRARRWARRSAALAKSQPLRGRPLRSCPRTARACRDRTASCKRAAASARRNDPVPDGQLPQEVPAARGREVADGPALGRPVLPSAALPGPVLPGVEPFVHPG